MNDTYMKQLLALMCAVDWLANDLHYRSKGPCFYEKHLLADRIRDLGDDDTLKEIYWLGAHNKLPPSDSDIAKMTIRVYEKLSMSGDYLSALATAFLLVINTIELCKLEEGLPGGVHSILDGISEKALTYLFLVKAQQQ